MSSINPNQLNAMAQEIYNLLDAKETADGVNNGKDKLGDSIWNKFVGPDENGKNQVGNGEKSKIEKEIPFQNAISSIASYIKNKGTAAIQEALKRIGIEWKPSVEVEANSNEKENNTNKTSDINDEISQKLEEYKKTPQYKKAVQARQEKMAKAQKKYDSTYKTAQNEKANNGMTYIEARKEYNKIKFAFRDVTKQLSDEEIIRICQEYINRPPMGMTENMRNMYKQKLETFLMAKEAMKELEGKHEDLSKIDSLYLASKGREIFKLPDDNDYMKEMGMFG